MGKLVAFEMLRVGRLTFHLKTSRLTVKQWVAVAQTGGVADNARGVGMGDGSK